MSRKQWLPDRVIVCGIAAFLGWLASELIENSFSADGHWFDAALTLALVTGALGVGINLADRTLSESKRSQGERILAGLLIGGLTGAISGSLGNLFSPMMGGTWLIGWGLMGLGLGAVEGLYERSIDKIRIGCLLGLAGGLVGGFLFEQIFRLLSPWSSPVARAVGFVILGLCLVRMIELAKALVCDAWLTVLDGDRPGRRVALSGAVATLGRAETATLSLSSAGNQMVDQEHARIILQKNGRYALQDNHSRHGTSVNLKRVSDRVELKDGDLIRIGPNSIRFQERRPQPVETEPSSKNPVKAPPSPQVVGKAASQPIAKSTSRDQKPSAKTTKGPQAAPPVPPTITETLPKGMTRCPSCRRLVTGSRPFCVDCKLAL